MTDSELFSALTLFANNLSKKGKSINTIVAYKGDINQLINFLAKINIVDVTTVEPKHLEDFKKDLAKENYTAKSISRKLNSIKNFFSFLKSEGVVVKDPSDEVKHPKYENDPPKVLLPIEYRSLRDACRNDARATAIVELMLQAGLRIKEIENLKIDQIRGSELLIEAYESHRERQVPLNNSAQSSLERYIKESRYQTTSKHVFVTKTGRHLLARNIRSLLNRYFAKADIKKVKVNDLRNTFIAYQLKAGVPLEIVSQVSGHKRISTTEKYLELIESKEENKGIKLKEL